MSHWLVQLDEPPSTANVITAGSRESTVKRGLSRAGWIRVKDSSLGDPVCAWYSQYHGVCSKHSAHANSAHLAPSQTLQDRAESPRPDIEVAGLNPDAIGIRNPAAVVFQVDVGDEMVTASPTRVEAIGEAAESGDRRCVRSFMLGKPVTGQGHVQKPNRPCTFLGRDVGLSEVSLTGDGERTEARDRAPERSRVASPPHPQVRRQAHELTRATAPRRRGARGRRGCRAIVIIATRPKSCR